MALQRRYLLVSGTFILSLLLYIDRACISVAKDPIAGTLGLSDAQMGWVLSIFALGYSLFQTPAGFLIDKYGPRRMLTAIVSFWSLFTALTGAAWNFISLLVIRFIFGAGEAGAFPGTSRAFFSWIPLQERGIVQGINFSGSRLGAAFALPAIALLIQTVGWRHSFMIQGSVVFLWAVLWYIFFRDLPEKHKLVPAKEKDYIMANRQATSGAKSETMTLSRLLGSKNMWLAMGQYFGSNFTFFFCLTWLLPHLKSKYNLEIVEAGFYASAPLIFGAIGNWVSGFLVDFIYRKGNWKMSRRVPAVTGFTLVIIGLVGSTLQQNIAGSVFFLSLAVFGADMTLSPSWSFCIDIGKRHSGTVSGTMNMAGNLGSFVTALAFPYLKVWTGSVVPFFVTGAVLALLSIVCWLNMDVTKEI
ncbi:MAG: MFS transporter [Bacteroidales bacterium]|nr:MFS transporter [Bacteroidales bacterium]